MTEYKIGEAAKLLGLTTQALRFYEQEGVITPRKSENGTRYYTPHQIVQLISFKKYRQMEMTVQDIVGHFKEGDVDQLITHMGRQRDQLLEKAQMMMRRAQAVERFEQTLRRVRQEAGSITLCQRPAMYLLEPEFDALDRMNDEQRESLTRYMDAMPDTCVAFWRGAENGCEGRFCLSIEPEMAKEWALPLTYARRLETEKCAAMPIRESGKPWMDEALEKLLVRAEEAGYQVDRSKNVLGIHLSSETIGENVHLCGVLYVPVI